MLTYYVLLIYTLGATLAVRQLLLRNQRKVLAIILAVGVFSVTAARKYTVGVDTARYVSFFLDLSSSPIESFLFYEPGYIIFLYLLKSAGFAEQGYILVTSLIAVASISVFIYRHSNNITLSFFIYLTFGLFALSMSAIRQTMAMGVILISISFIFERKFFAFFLLVLLATSFHYSAIFFAPIYFLYQDKGYTKKNLLAVFLIVSSLLMFGLWEAEILRHLTIEKYSARYLDGSDDGNINPLVVIVAAIIPLGVIALWAMQTSKPSNQDIFFFILILLSLFLTIFSMRVHMAIRMTGYLAPAYLILVPNALAGIKLQESRAFFLLFAIILLFSFFIITTPNGILEVGRYEFFFE